MRVEGTSFSATTIFFLFLRSRCIHQFALLTVRGWVCVCVWICYLFQSLLVPRVHLHSAAHGLSPTMTKKKHFFYYYLLLSIEQQQNTFPLLGSLCSTGLVCFFFNCSFTQYRIFSSIFSFFRIREASQWEKKECVCVYVFNKMSSTIQSLALLCCRWFYSLVHCITFVVVFTSMCLYLRMCVSVCIDVHRMMKNKKKKLCSCVYAVSFPPLLRLYERADEPDPNSVNRRIKSIVEWLCFFFFLLDFFFAL